MSLSGKLTSAVRDIIVYQSSGKQVGLSNKDRHGILGRGRQLEGLRRHEVALGGTCCALTDIRCPRCLTAAGAHPGGMPSVPQRRKSHLNRVWRSASGKALHNVATEGK